MNFWDQLRIWPFVELKSVPRNSRNRAAGTMKLKPTMVTREVYKNYLISKVLPEIQKKMNTWRDRTIYIHQNNSRPHVNENDLDVKNALQADRLKIKLRKQPPNSPEVNVLDLEFCNAIQSLQNEACATSTTELVIVVHEVFNVLLATK